ncbi:uncharacterized protein [Dermacentor andersoni]|uniref:uncharacterized protein n=1 Tax=Dermacentor andersoni TaxID=34620 RepID=UPI0024167219|nr:uncharacterized protein LOC129383910 [Dermacentor andersoni]
MSDDEEDPLKVITSDPVLRRQFFRSPRRQARERGASDDRPPRGGPFENSIIDDDKEEYIAMAVWIALALFAVAISVVVARGPHLDVGTRVLRRDSGYSRVPPLPWRPGSQRSNASQLRSRSSESAEQMERTRGNKAGAAGLGPRAANASVNTDEITTTMTTGDETAISKPTKADQSSSSTTRLREKTTEEDGGRASEQQIILW